MNGSSRLAAAPISWGICEVPGWGLELPRDRVLAEMRDLGFAGTELGAPGFLPADPGALRDVLAAYELRLVAGFVGLVLHDPGEVDATLAAADRSARLLAAAGADCFVTAVLTDEDWGPRQVLDDSAWRHVLRMLDDVDRIVREHGLHQAVHPHVGTVIERADEVERLLAGSTVPLCLDTGHVAIGGLDPLDLAHRVADRIGHVHLKDVNLATAARVTAGELSLMAGVQAGMFAPLGAGDVAVADIVETLEAAGYDGWYVLEQDVAITSTLPRPGEGPIVNVRSSLDYLGSLPAMKVGNAHG